jgi:hypothetical protein
MIDSGFRNPGALREEEMEAKRRPGRSPRRDHPVKLRSTLPGKLREWLRVQAFRERRDQSSVVCDALELYRERGRS